MTCMQQRRRENEKIKRGERNMIENMSDAKLKEDVMTWSQERDYNGSRKFTREGERNIAD